MSLMVERPVVEMDTPFGQVDVIVRSGSEVTLKAGDPHDTNPRGIVVNRVPYRLSLRLLRGEAGWWARSTDCLARLDRERDNKASAAAERRVERELVALVNKWAGGHGGALVEGERANLREWLARADESVRIAQERLREAEADRAEWQARLDALPPPIAAADEVDDTF